MLRGCECTERELKKEAIFFSTALWAKFLSSGRHNELSVYERHDEEPPPYTAVLPAPSDYQYLRRILYAAKLSTPHDYSHFGPWRIN